MPLTLKKASLFQSLRENLRHLFGAFLRDKLWRNYKEFFVLSLNLLALKPLGDFVEKALLLVI